VPDESREFSFDIGIWYDLSRMGKYLVYATAERGGKSYASNQVMVEVVNGIELRSVTKAAPGGSGRVLTYSLRYWARNRGEFLFLRVDDKENRMNYGVYLLGPLVRVFAPAIEVDRNGRITVVHQSGADRFSKTVFQFTDAGMQFVEQTHSGRGVPAPRAAPPADGADKPES